MKEPVWIYSHRYERWTNGVYKITVEAVKYYGQKKIRQVEPTWSIPHYDLTVPSHKEIRDRQPRMRVRRTPQEVAAIFNQPKNDISDRWYPR